MSHDSVAIEAIATKQPVASSEHVSPTPELHPRLCQQLLQARLAAAGSLELTKLLPLISACYDELDGERRGVVRSMQLIAEEARSFGDGLAGADAGHLQAILDHIKDVVITVAVDGSIKIFTPTGARVFGYSRAEVIGRQIERLLPELPVNGLVGNGLGLVAGPEEVGGGD